MTHAQFRELLPLYVLGALDGAELVAFEHYVESNRALCEAEIAEYQSVTDQLAMSTPPVAPAPQVLKRILTAIEPPPAQPLPVRRSSPLVWFPWVLAAAACVTIMMTLSSRRTLESNYNVRLAAASERINQLSTQIEERDRAVNDLRKTADALQADMMDLKAKNDGLTLEKAVLLKATDELRQRIDRQDYHVVALQRTVADQVAKLDLLIDPAIRVAQLADPAGKTKATAKVFWQAQRQSGLVVVSNLAPVLPGDSKALELWLICDGQAPVPAGLFFTDKTGHGIGEIKLAKQVACAAKFAVSVEPAAGVAAPTGPIVLLGQ